MGNPACSWEVLLGGRVRAGGPGAAQDVKERRGSAPGALGVHADAHTCTPSTRTHSWWEVIGHLMTETYLLINQVILASGLHQMEVLTASGTYGLGSLSLMKQGDKLVLNHFQKHAAEWNDSGSWLRSSGGKTLRK